MNTLNSVLGNVFSFLYFPFENAGHFFGLIFFSVATGFLMLLVFRLASHQEEIREVKNKIKGHFLELYLYRDDTGLMLRSQLYILKYNLKYLKYFIKPMLFLIVPVALIMSQLDVRFDRHALEVGESAIVKVKFRSKESFDDRIMLIAPDEITVETPPLRIYSKNEINWRIKAERDGVHSIGIRFEFSGKETINKSVTVGQSIRGVSQKRVRRGAFRQTLYPLENSLPDDSDLELVEIIYRPIRYKIVGIDMHWIVIFLSVSIASAFLFKLFFRVEI